jgi:hypothetical protein
VRSYGIDCVGSHNSHPKGYVDRVDTNSSRLTTFERNVGVLGEERERTSFPGLIISRELNHK